MKKWLAGILIVLTALVLAALAWLAVTVRQVAEEAFEPLTALNLGQVHVYEDMAMTAGEGFSAFVMAQYRSREDPTDLRQEALKAMTGAQGWHVEPVEAVQYRAVMAACLETPLPLEPAGDTVFEAWFFRCGDAYPASLPDARPDGDFALVFFDRETGAFLALTEEPVVSATAALPWTGLGLAQAGVLCPEGVLLRQAGDESVMALLLPDDARIQAERCFQSAGWRWGSVTQAEFTALMDAVQEEVWPRLLPVEGIVFDAWYWQGVSAGLPGQARYFPAALREQGVTDTQRWLAAFYDRESGLMVLVQRGWTE